MVHQHSRCGMLHRARQHHHGRGAHEARWLFAKAEAQQSSPRAAPARWTPTRLHIEDITVGGAAAQSRSKMLYRENEILLMLTAVLTLCGDGRAWRRSCATSPPRAEHPLHLPQARRDHAAASPAPRARASTSARSNGNTTMEELSAMMVGRRSASMDKSPPTPGEVVRVTGHDHGLQAPHNKNVSLKVRCSRSSALPASTATARRSSSTV